MTGALTADLVARAIVIAARTRNIDPLRVFDRGYPGTLAVRRLAGHALRECDIGVRSPVIARTMGVHPNEFSPSQLDLVGVFSEHRRAVIAELRGLLSDEPQPEPAPSNVPPAAGISVSAALASVRSAPRRAIDVEGRRLREALNEGGQGIFRRTDADRREPRAVVTSKLMGDPAPGRDRPAAMGPAEIASHNAAILRKINGEPS